MTSVRWCSKVRETLRKLPKEISRRIFNKIDKEVSLNPERYLEPLVNTDAGKIRVGEYRLFTDFYKKEDVLVIRAVRHRKKAYKL